MTSDWRSTLSRVKSALMRRGRSAHDADDLVQQAWVHLACYEREQAVEQPEAFLMRAALNLSIDSYRLRQSHGEEVLLEDVVLVDATPSPEAVLLARERVARLGICLGRLSPKTRNIFLAHRVEGRTYPQLAREHDLSVSTVEQHIAKAVLQLTTWMEGW